MATQQTFSFFAGDVASIARPRKRIAESRQPLSAVPGAVPRQLWELPPPPRRSHAAAVVAAHAAAHAVTLPPGALPPPGQLSCAPAADLSSDGRDAASETTSSASDASREQLLRQLRSQVGCVTTAPADRAPVFSTGCPALDGLLPQGGLRLDAFSEWVAESEGSGAATLALVAAASLLETATSSGPLVVVDPEGTFYPPAAVALGVAAERLVWVRPRRAADTVWAIDQALRCESVAAVWAAVPSRLDDRDARRFQLAAEMGGTPGLLIRPASVRGKPSFADARFHIATAARPATRDVAGGAFSSTGDSFSRIWRVTLDRCRGSGVGAGVWIELDENARLRSLTASEMAKPHETSALHLASRLADPAAARRSIRRNDSSQQRRA